jgi:short subunit dehydrogenase-like uncharacterized protein
MKMLRYIGPVLAIPAVQNLLKNWIGKKVKGPTEQERESDEMQLWGEVTIEKGDKVTLRMRTPEGYSLTVDASVAATLRLIRNGVPAGALTPSRAFGAEFVLSLPGVQLDETDG